MNAPQSERSIEVSCKRSLFQLIQGAFKSRAEAKPPSLRHWLQPRWTRKPGSIDKSLVFQERLYFVGQLCLSIKKEVINKISRLLEKKKKSLADNKGEFFLGHAVVSRIENQRHLFYYYYNFNLFFILKYCKKLMHNCRGLRN